jgi:hypothetical protein
LVFWAKEVGLKRIFRFLKFSSLGVFLTGIVAVLQGCTAKEGALLAALLVLLGLCSGPQQAVDESAPPPPPIIMFNGGTTDGNIGGRAGADAQCRASGDRPTGFIDDNIRAFLSTSDLDEIRDMPSNYGFSENAPLEGPTGITIANRFVKSLDDTSTPQILSTLKDAGAMNPSPDRYWSGSGRTGGAGLHCNGWMNTTDNGFVGRVDATTSGWLLANNISCSNVRQLLCIAITP